MFYVWGDWHCFVAQVNSIDFGDNRITQPSKTETKDLLRLTGGGNTYLVAAEIDLKALRNFQRRHKDYQSNNGIFKITPPRYDKDMVGKRQKYINQFSSLDID